MAVAVIVTKNGSPLTTATVSYAGDTRTLGPKTPVDDNGDVAFQVLPGTNALTAWDSSDHTTRTRTLAVATATSTTRRSLNARRPV
jgi:hypothetical protein